MCISDIFSGPCVLLPCVSSVLQFRLFYVNFCFDVLIPLLHLRSILPFSLSFFYLCRLLCLRLPDSYLRPSSAPCVPKFAIMVKYNCEVLVCAPAVHFYLYSVLLLLVFLRRLLFICPLCLSFVFIILSASFLFIGDGPSLKFQRSLHIYLLLKLYAHAKHSQRPKPPTANV